jgi:MFS-type transporter involved in bile tolerance (Atg22 family)
LLAGRSVAGRPLVKRAILIPALAARAALLLAVALVALLARRAPMWALAILLGCYLCFMLGHSTASVPWFDLFAKAIASGRRGRFFGVVQAIQGLVAIGAGFVVRAVLNRAGWPVVNHLVLISVATLFLFAHTVATALVREPRGSEQIAGVLPWRACLPRLVGIMRRDRCLRWCVVARWFAGLADVAVAFYAVYALERLGLPEVFVGLFASAQVAGNVLGGLIMGHAADRRGPGRAIAMAMFLRLLCPALALLAPHLGAAGTVQPLAAMLAVFVLTGAIDACYLVGFSNYVLAVAPPGERALYVGLANTLGGVVAPAPLLAGWLVQATSYRFLFCVALATAAIGSAIALRVPQTATAETAERKVRNESETGLLGR